MTNGNSRIAECFARLKRENNAGLVTFTMASDPDYDTSLEVLKSLPAMGADIIELGMPFSDPMADGPAIQAAGIRALEAGGSLAATLAIVKSFREENHHTPLILMGYYNPVYRYGVEQFVTDAQAAGVDGFIIVDLPPEEDDRLFTASNAAGLSLIKLVTPTTDAKRMEVIVKKASGFIYYVSVAGITGTGSATTASIEEALTRFRMQTDLPIVVGFGIKAPTQAAAIAKHADAVVVGSALVDALQRSPEEALTLVKSLSKAVQDNTNA